MTMMIRTRDQLIDQHTVTVNALRGHLAEFGLIAPVGLKNVDRLRERIEEGDNIPPLAVEMAEMHFAHIAQLSQDIERLATKITTHCSSSQTARWLQTMPGIGPIVAMVIEAFAPDMQRFSKGRDFAAWPGLIPRQQSSGGKPRRWVTRRSGTVLIRYIANLIWQTST